MSAHAQERETLARLANAIIQHVEASDATCPAPYDDAHTAHTGTTGNGAILGHAVVDLARQLDIGPDVVTIEEPSRDLQLPLPWGPPDDDGVRVCRTPTHEWQIDQHWHECEAIVRVRRR